MKKWILYFRPEAKKRPLIIEGETFEKAWNGSLEIIQHEMYGDDLSAFVDWWTEIK